MPPGSPDTSDTDGRRGARRAVAGVVVGASAGLAFGLIEALYVVIARPLAFDETAERVRFALCTIGLLLATGVIAGTIGALLLDGVDAIAARIARLRDERSRERIRAALIALAAAPAITSACVLAFRGRRMQLLPAPSLLAAIAALLGVVLAFSGILVARRGFRALAAARVGARALATLASVVLAIALVATSAHVLPRLYGFFHVGLAVLTGLALAFGASLLLVHVRPPRARWPVVALAIVGLWCGRWALRQYSFWPVLRAVAFEETQAESRLLALAAQLHVAPAAVQPPEPSLPAPPPPSPAALPPGPRAGDADFFLITVDAMRGDRLAPRTAPRLSALAETGVVFDRAYSQVPHTSFSLTTLLTGKYAWSLAALGDVGGAGLAAHETLADLFKRERYKTAAFFPPSVFYIDHERFTALEESAFRFEYVKYEFMDAPGRTDQVIKFLDAEKPDRVFAWVHYFDPHEPYEEHEDIDGGAGAGRTAVERYDGEVRYVDREVARLVDWIAAHRRRAVIAFTADHGEEFGEHGGRYHGSTLYEEQVRVPLFLVSVGREPASIPRRHVGGAVGLIDLAPTLLSLADLLPSAKMRGRDLGPWLAAAAPPPEATARLAAFAEIGGKKLIAAGDDRLVCDVSRDFCELYDLGADPGEQRNLAGREPAKVAQLKQRLDEWMASHSAFERAPAAGDKERVLGALERCRLGDRAAVPEVATLLRGDDDQLREAAARSLLALPDDPAIRPTIEAAHRARPDDRLLGALALRAGDLSLAAPLGRAAGEDPSRLDPQTRAEVALALVAMQQGPDRTAAVRLLGRVLPAVTDEEVKRRAVAALGDAGRPEALGPLVDALEDVRLGADAARALGRLRDRRAVVPIIKRLADEPYVHARAEEARALGVLGDPRAIRPLQRALRAEDEPVVQAALREALARLGVR